MNEQNNQFVPPNIIYPNAYIKPKKVYVPLDKKDRLYFVFVFISVFLFVDSVSCGFRLGFTLFYLFNFVVTTLYLFDKKRKPGAFALICGALSVLESVSFALFDADNYLMIFLKLVLTFLLYSVYSLGMSNGFSDSVSRHKMLFDLVYDTFCRAFKGIGEVFGSFKAGSKKDKNSIWTFAGIAFSLPVLLVVVPLLIKSDAAFEGLANKIFSNMGSYIGEFVFALIIFPYFVSFLYTKKENLIKLKPIDTAALRKIPYTACVSFLTVISLVYVLYLFSQLAYFFSAFSLVLPEGYKFTASSFARRGFYEMFAVCMINILLISVINAFSKRLSNGKTPLTIKLLSAFVSLFNILLIICTMQKMKLNVSIYGLSENRVLVSTFMIMIFVVMLFFIAHIFVPKLPYMQATVIICSLIFVTLSFSNMSSQITRYNIIEFNNKQIVQFDIDAACDMGDGAVPYLIELAKNDDVISQKAVEMITSKIWDDYSDYFSAAMGNEDLIYTPEYNISNYNYSRQKSAKAIYDYYVELKNTDEEKAYYLRHATYKQEQNSMNEIVYDSSNYM